MTTAHTARATGEFEWYTPVHIVERVRLALGAIDLDPASCEAANRTVRATRYYDQDADGLFQLWSGRVFLNPPYRQPMCTQFVNKLLVEVAAGRVAAACCLTNNASETKWGQSLLGACAAVAMLRGRLNFGGPHASKTAAPLQGQMITYFGPDPDRFGDAFGGVARILRAQRWSSLP